MFIVIIFLLSLLSVIEVANGGFKKAGVFKFCWFFLTIVLCFRYGQGTDYFNYYLQYESIDVNSSLLVNTLYHGELGWYILMLLCNRMGVGFDFFIGGLSLVMMLCIYRAITLFSPYKILSLLLFFPTYYMTYCFSAIRQGVVMCLFLGILLPSLLEKKYRNYYIWSVILIFIHASAIVFLFIPAFNRLKYNRTLYKLFLLGAISVLLWRNGVLDSVSPYIFTSSYMEESFSIGAVAMRLILFVIILTLYNGVLSFLENDSVDHKLYSIYYFGMLIYMVLFMAATLSQRISMPFKSIEVVLLPRLLYLNKVNSTINYKKRFAPSVYLIILMVLMNVELVKNINSYINQGSYSSNITALNYPYTNVFNKTAVFQYRDIREYD